MKTNTEKVVISKSTFLEFLHCPKNTWLKLHKPEMLADFTLSEFEKHLVAQGNEVELEARKLFPDAVLITETKKEAEKRTKELMEAISSNPKSPKPEHSIILQNDGMLGKAILQGTFFVDGFYVKTDVMTWDEKAGVWDVYEIKGTNAVHDEEQLRDHIDDLTFQVVVLERAGVKTGKHHIIHLNKSYVRQGALDIHALFEIEDQTEVVAERREKVEGAMAAAKEYLSPSEEPKTGCDCNYRGRSKQCTTFQYSHPKVPEYSIHDLTRIGNSKKKLELLVDGEIYHLHDIPEDVELSEPQENQVRVHKKQKPIIHTKKIKEELDGLKFPLYFLDYETFAPAIPIFSGYSPYTRIPFQFVLYILKEPGAELERVDFLQETKANPVPGFVKTLEENIKPGGTVVIWYVPFERSTNQHIAKLFPEHKEVLERINGQMYDLRDIFTKQYYVHPDFRGSTSIKKVLPALVPELSYKDLLIQEGTAASDAWREIIAEDTPPARRAELAEGLKKYCGLDTYAMYAIWKHLTGLEK